MKLKLVAAGAVIALVVLAVANYSDQNGDAREPKADAIAQSSSAPAALESLTSTQSLGDTIPDRSYLAESSSTQLFSDAADADLDHQVLEGFLKARPIGAYRIVRVDGDLLRTRIRQSATTPSFEIQLLDSAPITLVAEGAKEHTSGWQSGHGSWIGAVEGDEFSRASFVVGADGSVNGVIRTSKTGRIKIEPVKGTPHHIIWQWDSNYERTID